MRYGRLVQVGRLNLYHLVLNNVVVVVVVVVNNVVVNVVVVVLGVMGDS